mgnify:FL=1
MSTGSSLSSSGEENSFSASTSKTFSTSSSQKHLLKPHVGTVNTSTPRGGKTFTLSELSKATKKFHPSCKIGQGGFGIVYIGKLQDGTVVAIKRAKKVCLSFYLVIKWFSSLVKFVHSQKAKIIFMCTHFITENLRFTHFDGV